MQNVAVIASHISLNSINLAQFCDFLINDNVFAHIWKYFNRRFVTRVVFVEFYLELTARLALNGDVSSPSTKKNFRIKPTTVKANNRVRIKVLRTSQINFDILRFFFSE